MRIQGKVIHWVADRGFGFIEGDDRTQYFAHIHAVDESFDFDDLPIGTRVEFETQTSRKYPGKLQAADIKIIREAV